MLLVRLAIQQVPMMFLESHSAIDLAPDELSNGKFILISETSDVDSSFILHHFLTQYLKNGERVCMLALFQSFFHYQIVAKKVGTNLVELRDKGQLVFIEGLKMALDIERNSAHHTNPYSSIILQENPSLEALFRFLEDEISRTRSEKEADNANAPSLFIIDDLSVLVNLGVSINDILRFIHDCRMLCLSFSMCFLVLTHMGNPKDAENDESATIASYLTHLADVSIDVFGLSTGHSKDVHGQMTVTHMDLHCKSTEIVRCQKHMHYKIDERNVHIFIPGSLTDVLW